MKTTLPYGLLTCLLLAAVAQGAAQTSAPKDETPVDQVVVAATRATLIKLAKEVRMAELRFYQRYNELNTKRDYAINCRNQATTGSRFKWTDCTPVFQDKAQEAEGRAFGQSIQSAGSGAITVTPALPASLVTAAGRPGFQQNVIDVTRKNPDLIKLLEDYGTRVKQYEDTFRKISETKSSTNAKAVAPATPVPSQAPPTSP